MINRIHPYAQATDPVASQRFYVEVFGLEVAMTEPVIGLQSPDNPSAQLIIPPVGMDDPPPQLGIDVGHPDAVDAAYREAQLRGAEIVRPLTDEPWGVRRFFVRDPAGTVINVLAHMP